MNNGSTTGTGGTDQMAVARRSRDAAFDSLVAEPDPEKRLALRERYRFACCWVQELEERGS